MNRIKELRMKAQITQLQLAERMDVGQSAVAAWESGNSMPRADKLPELARVLGCTVDELYGNPKKEPGT